MINHQLKYLKSVRYERDKRSNKQRRDVLCCFIISILECRVGGEARYRGEGAEVRDGGEGGDGDYLCSCLHFNEISRLPLFV